MHYYLADDSHAMDAIVRNKCEAELLAIYQEVSSVLGVRVRIESLAYQEGGLKEIWKFIGENNVQLSLLLAFIVLVLSRFPVSDPEKDALDKEISKLTIEEKKLLIEERRLSVEKLKKEIRNGIEPEKETFEDAAKAVNQSLKVLARKSNFYQNLSGYEKVVGVGYVPVDENDMAVQEEQYVSRSDFKRFVIFTNELPVEIIDDAEIEIVSPVLKEGNYKWKGIFRDELISFSMTDAEFKGSVLREEVSFQHGSVIDCVLNVYRKFDEIGDVVVTGYSVVTVLQKTEGVSTIETPQGKRHKAYKKFDESQTNLF